MTQWFKKTYPNISETFYSASLTNGLQLFLIPKKDFKEKSGFLTVHFGSLDNSFTLHKHHKTYPKGIAHFLEHKLFELEDGEDVSDLFSGLGADSNAFTTFDKTCFYFSTSDNFRCCLILLQNFIRTTNFSKKSIDKEKSIIEQEIDMYQDDADYRLYQGILENLYPETVLADDIAGTKQSISDITVTDLKENHKMFYRPDNMTLVLVGDFKEDEILSDVISDQKEFSKESSLSLPICQVAHVDVIPSKSIQMDVTIPKLAIGYRGQPLEQQTSSLKQLLGLRLFFAMLLGWTSETYQHYYDSGDINDSFDIEVEVHRQFQFVMISLDTKEPIAMSTKIRQFLKSQQHERPLTIDNFQIIKKEMYGDFLRSLDSVEHLSSQFVYYLGHDETYFDIPDILNTFSLEEVVNIGENFLKEADITDFTIFPK